MLSIWNFIVANWLTIISYYFAIGFVAEAFFWTRYLFLSARNLKQARSSLLAKINKVEVGSEIIPSQYEMNVLYKAKAFVSGMTNVVSTSKVLDALDWIEKNPPNFSLSRATGQTILWPIFMTVEGWGLIEDSVKATWKKAKGAINFVSAKLWSHIVK
jgi:hypothetical protein